MTQTVNFDVAVDHDLLKRAKVVAPKCDTSIDALLNAQLRFLVESFESAEFARNANYTTLLAFSLGKLDDFAAMQALAIDREEDLFVLMAQAHLPMPRLAEADTAGMVNALRQLPR